MGASSGKGRTGSMLPNGHHAELPLAELFASLESGCHGLQLPRILEPRVLLDAAAIETALEISSASDVFASSAAAGINDHAALLDALGYSVPEAAAENLGDPDATVPSVAGPDALALPVEVYFLDSGIQDQDDLLAAIPPGAEVHVLDGDSDGVEQISELLAGRSGIGAIHIVSHGSAGQLELGSASLTLESMSGEHAEALSIIRDALSDNADIMIYGCEFAAGEEGQAAIVALAEATGADIAASIDLTGAASRGGDWDLEQTTGTIEAGNLVATVWDGLLTKTVINPAGGSAIDGSDGLRIHVMTNGQYQIDFKGAGQLYAPGFNDDNTVLFNGIYMSVGTTVVGPATDLNNAAPYSGAVNGPGIASTDVTFREAGQTITGAGTKDDPFLVMTTLYYDANNNGTYNPATDYQLVVVTGYSAPDGYMTLDMTVTPPPGNTQVIKLYHTLDTFLSGGDNGPAFSLPQNLAQTNNTTGDPTLVAVRKDPGGPNDSFVGFAEAQGGREFDHWFSGQYNSANIYGNGINNGGDIDNGWDTNPATDNGVAVQFTLGAITSAENWSYHIAFSSEATIDLDSDDSSGASGSAYNTEYPAGSGLTIPVVDTDAHIANVTGDILQVRAARDQHLWHRIEGVI